MGIKVDGKIKYTGLFIIALSLLNVILIIYAITR
jgi:hypothetical protein